MDVHSIVILMCTEKRTKSPLVQPLFCYLKFPLNVSFVPSLHQPNTNSLITSIYNQNKLIMSVRLMLV